MSYSRIFPCSDCTSIKECTDHVEIENAICKIHTRNKENGHLGSGSIEIHCQNKITLSVDEDEKV